MAVNLQPVPSADPGTSEWWLQRLGYELDARNARIAIFDRYDRGEHELAFATAKFREAFGGLLTEYADNFCPLVINAPLERLHVEGFRFGDEAGDDEAWRMWQANNLDTGAQMAHREALVKGISYAIVWSNPDDPDTPLITPERPEEVITYHAAWNPNLRRAALKRWWDDEVGEWHATLYLPDRIEKYRVPRGAGNPLPVNVQVAGTRLGGMPWQRREVGGEPWPLPNPLGVVPVIPLPNEPALAGEGRSELVNVIPLQRAINKLMCDMLVASEYGAFRQRYAIGVEIPVDPDTGQPAKDWEVAMSRFLSSPNDQAKFGDFAATDLGNFVKAVETHVQHIATQSNTPPHYLLAQSVEGMSGEGLKATEAGLTSKVRGKQRHFGEGWEETMRLAFRIRDDARGNLDSAETIWRDPERRTDGERVDAAMKLHSMGLPFEAALRYAGFSVVEAKRLNEERIAEQLLQATLNPTPDQPADQPAEPAA